MITKTVDTKYVELTNRNNGRTGYDLSNGLHRSFNLNETKKIPLEELQELMSAPGGECLLKNYFIINDKTALEELNIETEPEYFYTEEDIKILLETGSLDQLEDCLNFAPQGVIDIVKDLAVKLEVPDTRKRKLILQKTGFSVDNAIMVNNVLEENTEKVEEPKTTRKAQPIQTTDNEIKRKVTIINK